MLPKVILHNSISLDGRNEGFMPDLGLHYELVMSMGYDFDIHLTGSGTILGHEEQLKAEPASKFEPPKLEPEDTSPILVIPDSTGQIKAWYMLRQEPYWRDCIALCTESTPTEFLEYLKERYIKFIISGKDHVDFKKAFELLNNDYGAKTILLDSGGTLNGILLREGLVSEISLLVHPLIVGGAGYNSVVKLYGKETLDEKVRIKLRNAERKMNDLLWLRYDVNPKTIL